MESGASGQFHLCPRRTGEQALSIPHFLSDYLYPFRA